MMLNKSQLEPGFWETWQRVNADQAIFHQWDQLERSGCLDNFRILAEGKDVFRQGWYFADSDAYKWLEAAFLILLDRPNSKLQTLVDQFIDLVEKVQSPDGYIYTFNQIHFPDDRWKNLQIEHELYCHGHLIEAFASGSQLEEYKNKILIACKAADRIVMDFQGKGPDFTPGHEEIEIALLRLFEVTNSQKYLEMSINFLENRGKISGFAMKLINQALSNGKRIKDVSSRRANYFINHPNEKHRKLPEINQAQKPANIQLRWFGNTLSGKFFQQHQPIKKQTKPVGHAVRFTYLKTAEAMLDRLQGTDKYLDNLEKSWHALVTKQMYITGGVGSLPVIEGFGRNYELDPAFAYAETCAALGSLFWNREMASLTGKVCYSDLYEWQLYNAALVGMGREGTCYFYNNPMLARGKIQRQGWFEVPCCPSNLSRTFARLQKDILRVREDRTINIEQYISSQHRIFVNSREVELTVESDLPWEGHVNINIGNTSPSGVRLNLRLPSWSGGMTVRINEHLVHRVVNDGPYLLHPQNAKWVIIEKEWLAGDRIELDIDMPVRFYHPHPKIKALHGKSALTRGPLVYCLESVDNPNVDLFDLRLDPESISVESDMSLFKGARLIKARTTDGNPIKFIPYFLWGNRGPSQMTVFFIDHHEEIK